jgi:hypothetical protein
MLRVHTRHAAVASKLHQRPMEVAVEAQELLGIKLEGRVG